MKVTKEIHDGWKGYENLPKEIKDKLMMGNMFGKYHYHYTNENGTIGLIKIQCATPFLNGSEFGMAMMWEACGVLDFQRFATKKEAEKEIYKALKEISSLN